MDALAFLAARSAKLQPVYALVGDEDFLKRHVRERILALALGGEEPAYAVSVFQGDKITFSALHNELDTVSFFTPCRVVVVETADAFVTAYRGDLEAYVAQPSTVGILILDVKVFAENTKLAKALPDAAKIACKAPPVYKLPDWCIEWAKSAHHKKLAQDAAELLVERVGPTMGLLDQELAKLAVAVGDRPGIIAEDVDALVGRSRAADVFRILEAIGEGKPATALSILQELFAEGEDPMAILGPLTAQLRKLATVARLVVYQKMPLGSAMDVAKVPGWEKARVNFERQLKRLTRARLLKLTDWLVELNLGLKGGNPLPERVQIERLVVTLARALEK